MEVIFEVIFEVMAELWASLLEKIWDPARSRARRIFAFLLFYLPVAAILVFFGYAIYDRTDIVLILISYAFYALAVLLFCWLGKKAWFGKAPKEPKAMEKMGNGIEKFIKAYKNTINDKSVPTGKRILFFALPHVPMMVLIAVMAVLLPDVASFFGCGFGIYCVCLIILAGRLFRKK
jgi:hypothetical protein